LYVYVSNESTLDVNVYFDDLKITHKSSLSIVQADDYYPFGLTFNEYQNQEEQGNDFLYNGKELQTDFGLDWYDYGARMYDAALGRFHVMDRFATKYFSHSPYHYVSNNPLKYIDVNGDSINVSKLLTSVEGLYTLFNTISDLQDMTGLNISVNSTGKLVSNGKVKKDKNGNTIGSKKARKYVSSLIGDKDDIVVNNNNKKTTEGGGRGYVNLNSDQIDDNITSATTAGLSELTFGYGMSFLHETVHTAIGTKIFNPTATSTINDNISNTYPAGPTVSKVNEFRNELGLAERTQYAWTTPSANKAATNNWSKNGNVITITQGKMDVRTKAIRRANAIVLKRR